MTIPSCSVPPEAMAKGPPCRMSVPHPETWNAYSPRADFAAWASAVSSTEPPRRETSSSHRIGASADRVTAGPAKAAVVAPRRTRAAASRWRGRSNGMAGLINGMGT
ncbi:hypothetical protein SI859A1_01781 [Aurantimonas manganoxydans SI85-9A1]|uniref:Uncharacterized protein n=1 Tax=Aurantimonas manganoxydans (strain ATCC BAA-1229 / DSM 21871 / SI85-9A1) TaxID=287752 RepID=Q1YNQ3_AURMS|nr:hypothetical protein SI859A1_01781 [Aurantimonas manganoxydans SI85-9A1]